MDIQSMSTLEKLQAMEQIWESLDKHEEVTPPAWHGEVVQKRREALHEEADQYTPLEQVRKRGMR